MFTIISCLFQITYGSFHYTSLLYLTEYGKDFTGGRFVFVDADTNRTVEPRAGIDNNNHHHGLFD